MPRAPESIPSSTAPKLKMPPKAVTEAIVRRYLKEDQTIYWAREIPAFYGLYKAYPCLAFWQAHELAFKLNHMTWFEGVEGKAELERAWLLWHYNPPPLDAAPEPAYTPETADISAAAAPTYTPPPRRARTVAEMMGRGK